MRHSIFAHYPLFEKIKHKLIIQMEQELFTCDFVLLYNEPLFINSNYITLYKEIS